MKIQNLYLGYMKEIVIFLKFAMYPEIINEVKQLIGEDIILWGSSLFCKKEKNGKETPWHQDGEYWPIKPLRVCYCLVIYR